MLIACLTYLYVPYLKGSFCFTYWFDVACDEAVKKSFLESCHATNGRIIDHGFIRKHS